MASWSGPLNSFATSEPRELVKVGNVTRRGDYSASLEGRLLDLERVVVRGLVLFVGRRKEIRSRRGLPKVEIDRNLFVATVTRCCNSVVCLNVVSRLVAGNGHFVLAWCTKAGKDDLDPNQGGRQRYGLQGAGLLAPQRAGVPEIYSFRNNCGVGLKNWPAHVISSHRDEDRGDHEA